MKKLRLSLCSLALVVALVAPAAALEAQTTPSTGTTSTKISIPNPIKCDTASCLISQVIRTILGVVAVVATGMFVWGGVLMLTSGGNERRVTQAKETLVWAAIGIVVIMVSWILIRFVLDALVGQNSNNSSPQSRSPAPITRLWSPFVV